MQARCVGLGSVKILLLALILATVLNTSDSVAEGQPELVIVRLFLELFSDDTLLLRVPGWLRCATTPALVWSGAARVVLLLRLLLLRLWLVVAEKEVEGHVVGEADTSVALFDEGRVQADSLTNLLLHEVIPVAPNLEIVLHFGTHSDYSLADQHLG